MDDGVFFGERWLADDLGKSTKELEAPQQVCEAYSSDAGLAKDAEGIADGDALGGLAAPLSRWRDCAPLPWPERAAGAPVFTPGSRCRAVVLRGADQLNGVLREAVALGCVGLLSRCWRWRAGQPRRAGHERRC